MDHMIEDWFAKVGPHAIAVSGGVDSMTLAACAHRGNPASVMFHAVSPAVPKDATERVERYGRRFNWNLQLVDAREFHDPQYVENPINRCFYCKKNLYGVIRQATELPMASGTNCDDLQDFRPGLDAASKHGVRHPFVEFGYHKRDVRALAHQLGLDELGDLPASPCLASRVETGIAIDAKLLPLVDEVEGFVKQLLNTKVVRCRILKSRIVIQVESAVKDRLDSPQFQTIERFVRKTLRQDFQKQSFTIEPYVMGSAFIKGSDYETRH